MTNFKPGDVVRLKSGGPPMTVEQEEGEGYKCVWFEGKKRNSEWFHRDLLEKSGPKSVTVHVVRS